MSTLAPPRVEPVPDDRAHISRVPYLPGLDGMRALAVVAVMVYHANSDWLPGGFFGVEMFFVISGYLITLLLISERERTYRISLRHFWLRRARRLLPALFTMMFLVTAWTAIFKTEALGALRGDVIAGFFYVSNWYQIWEGLGYTAAGDFAPLRHLWSLAVEEQFYLLWPVVMIFLLGRNGTRQVAAVSRWLFVCAVLITVAVALLFYPGPIAEPNVTPEAYWWFGDRPINKIDTLYLGTISRLSGILLGAAFAMVWRPLAIVRGPLRSKGRLFDAVALAGIIGFAWLCWNTYLATPSGADPFVFRGGIFLAGLATLSIIAAVTHRGAYANRLLGNRVFRWIGTRSYGLYLYHWPIYQMIRGVAGNKLTFGEFVYALVLTVIVTELSYRFVETPIRQGRFSARWRQIFGGTRRGPKVVASAAVAMAVVVGLAVGSVLMTAPLEKNEIAQALDAGEEFTTDLLAVDDIPVASTTTTSTTPTTTTEAPPATTAPAVLDPTLDSAPPTTVPPTTVPPTTVPPTTAPPAPVGQLGVVTSLEGLAPLAIPPTVSGFPLVALGDSVMLGAAEELQARGFQVDALQSRQMNTFVPTMQALRDNGTFGSVVVVHLGTNGSFSQETLDAMLATVADVPVVLLLTGKADRGWIAGNNDKLRAVPSTHPNVTVVDWEVLSSSCEGRCFYDDGIHLTQSGQNFYADIIGRVLAQP
ncbi:MAG TPA: acyltransferase family protein [Ilumatobacteraceae bacterium]|jgi:peptidoglycan/LPS O-acetylase OafA/YrhL|nr:acyltransferase family protein [Ilumatobacteraceae bacterium]